MGATAYYRLSMNHRESISTSVMSVVWNGAADFNTDSLLLLKMLWYIHETSLDSGEFAICHNEQYGNISG